MILCLDVGNSHIFGGVFANNVTQLRFRYSSEKVGTSDQLGLFFRQVLRENGIDPSGIQSIALSSVVPSIDYSIIAACIKYFSIEPFLLKAGVKTGLKINIINPAELGADLIATAIGAIEQFPQRDLIVLDLGTAITMSAILADKTFLGCVIMPGMKTAVTALAQKAAKLPVVDIIRLEKTHIRNSVQSIQTGIYFGQLGAIKEIIARLKQEHFAGKQPLVLATGGFAHLFDQQHLFTVNIPDLVLHGLRIAMQKNQFN